MANFEADPKVGGRVQYAEVALQDSGKHFQVQWINVTLTDQPELGTFSFQSVLQENGDIFFLYHKVPVNALLKIANVRKS